MSYNFNLFELMNWCESRELGIVIYHQGDTVTAEIFKKNTDKILEVLDFDLKYGYKFFEKELCETVVDICERT